MTSALRVTSGPLDGRVLLLPDDRAITIGASLECDLVLFNSEIWKEHVRVEPRNNGGHRVEAIDDAPVQVGAEAIKKRALENGDEVKISDSVFVYEKEHKGDGDDDHADRRLLATRTLADYRILRKVQMTELDVTYMGEPIGGGQRVAIRLFKAEHLGNQALARRFLSRAMAALSLNHPQFSTIYRIGSLHGACYVVKELVEDQMRWERFVRDKSPLSPKSAVKIGLRLVDLLSFARTRRLLVARRKPTGLYVLRRNRLHVANFDLSRELEDSIVKTAAFNDFLEANFQFDSGWERGDEHDKLDRLEREPKGLQEQGVEGIDVQMIGRFVFQLLTGRVFDVKNGNRIIIEGYGQGGTANRKGPLAETPKDLVLLLAKLVTGDAGKRVPSLEATSEALSELKLEKS